ncbi:MAG: class I SAM-dependent methyltransferase [Bacteroidota bacterium]
MRSYLKTKDYSVSGEEFQLLHDVDFDMLITQPQPERLEEYYQSENYISHSDSNVTFLEKAYQAVKKYNLTKKVKLIKPYLGPQKSILDVGAGTGDFLIQAKHKGLSITGLEPNLSAREKALKKGIELYEDFESLPLKGYEVITLWHVLEHLPNLESQIKKLKSLLVKDGTLIIAVPNFRSYDAKYYGRFWAAYDVPRHLWHFSNTAIKKIFAQHRMEVLKTRPMLFDAFYVSMLSEKYKKGNYNYVKSLFIGLLSNIRAWNTQEYSSRIYVIKNS